MDAPELTGIITAAITRIFDATDLRFDSAPPYLDYRPPDESWPPRLILEHMVLANRYLLLLIEKGARRALHRRVEPGTIEALLAGYTLDDPRFDLIARNDAFPWECPPHMVPRGERPLSDVRDELRRQAASCHALIDRLRGGEGVLALTHLSVQRLGRIDVYRYLWFMLKHLERHLDQLNAIEAQYRRAAP